jgi:hypothetical protein
MAIKGLLLINLKVFTYEIFQIFLAVSFMKTQKLKNGFGVLLSVLLKAKKESGHSGGIHRI